MSCALKDHWPIVLSVNGLAGEAGGVLGDPGFSWRKVNYDVKGVRDGTKAAEMEPIVASICGCDGFLDSSSWVHYYNHCVRSVLPSVYPKPVFVKRKPWISSGTFEFMKFRRWIRPWLWYLKSLEHRFGWEPFIDVHNYWWLVNKCIRKCVKFDRSSFVASVGDAASACFHDNDSRGFYAALRVLDGPRRFFCHPALKGPDGVPVYGPAGVGELFRSHFAGQLGGVGG